MTRRPDAKTMPALTRCSERRPLRPLLFLMLLASLPAMARDWVVAADGSGDYRTLQQALDAVPDGNRERQVIRLRAGFYPGVVTVAKGKDQVSVIGAGAGASVISWNNYADRIDPATGKALRTSGSATMYVYGDGFIAEDLTIENTAGNVGQALALYAAAPHAGFRNVRLLGNQDTLYTHLGSVLHFKDCYIEGTVDFIFGGATALFDDCTVVSKGPLGYVTAASTPEGQRFGYVFRRAILRGEGSATTYLGRPWRPFARTVFIDSDLGGHLFAAGWHDWDKPDAQATTYYGEFGSKGAGAAPEERVSWSHHLSGDEAAQYTTTAILGDWRPFEGD
ncbi:pectinesterase family protein [Pseudoxanthomonas sp.]|uniref:pectinesterase family protein n=1 Tax=Pseudoxanthomonas sp. TaxID=1871049 RepID=UPI00260DCAB8|nr:pectinesterase family protein [Pseudoxanthomonas sp.]WDS35207.1 MAG: pectinesterase family protein [Pseudoxanthomonas sp.]